MVKKILRQIKKFLYRFSILKGKRFVSKGEQFIENYLKSRHIKYMTQYKLNRVNSKVRKYFLVDFYLPKHNLFIEYNGRQHYQPVEFFGGEKAFKIQSIRDSELREYCKKKHIQLLEIPYCVKLNDSYLSNVLFQKLISYEEVAKYSSQNYIS